MATKRCKNGHLYDESIYGDHCPLCPSTGSETVFNAGGNEGGGTLVDHPQGGGNDGRTQTIGNVPMGGGGSAATSAGTVTIDPADMGGGHTRIQRVNPAGTSIGSGNGPSGRKVIGVLVSYDTNPLGDIFRLFEGKNLIGRRSTCDIPLTKDNNISGEHAMVLYREAEGVFWLIDQNSSNGTYLNGEFAGEKVRINTGDVIKMGDTRLIFWAIPKIK